MGETRELTVPGRYENIPTITEFVSQVAADAGLSEKESYHCQMSVDEACTNVIEHAYGGENRGDITLICTVEPGRCTIQIIDQGRPFDPGKVPEPHLRERIEDVQPGGIGLHLMRQLMDDVKFNFLDGENRLTLIKSHTAEPQNQALAIPIHTAGNDVWVVSPQGRMDSNAAPELETVLMNLLNQGHISLVLNMESVSYISSRGLKTCITVWQRVSERGGNLRLCGVIPHVHTIIETVGFTEILEIYGTVKQAVDAFAKDEKR